MSDDINIHSPQAYVTNIVNQYQKGCLTEEEFVNKTLHTLDYPAGLQEVLLKFTRNETELRDSVVELCSHGLPRTEDILECFHRYTGTLLIISSEIMQYLYERKFICK